MKCERIRQHLSEYMDETLDASTQAEVEKHLSECKGCNEEFHKLKSLVGELKAMDTVKAPADFLERVHERMESKFDLGRLFRRIFVPVRIKIPLEFAAVAATAVLVFTIFHAQQQKIRVSPAPEIRSRSGLSDKKPPMEALESIPDRDVRENAQAREEVPAAPSAAPEEPTAVAGRSQKEVVKSLQEEKGSALVSSSGALKKSWEGRETEAIQLTLMLPADTRRGTYLSQKPTGKALTPSESDEIGGIAGAAEEGVSDGEAKEVKKEKALTETHIEESRTTEERVDTFASIEESESKDEVDAKSVTVDQAFSQVEDLIENMGGSVISTVYSQEPRRIQSVLAEIPIKNYNIFIERLKVLAPLQTSHTTISGTDREPVRVRVRFLVPE